MKLNLKDATFILSNKNKKLNELTYSLHSFGNYPLSLNSVEQDNSKEINELHEILNKINELIDEIKELKIKIEFASFEAGIPEKLTIVKIKRNLYDVLKLHINNKNKAVTENIGIVKYGPLDSKNISETVELLEQEIENLSLEIDELNRETFIEID